MLQEEGARETAVLDQGGTMKIHYVAGLMLALLASSVTARAEIATCTESEINSADAELGWNAPDNHALFSIPTIVYNRPKVSILGLELRFVVDEHGEPVCLEDENNIVHNALKETPERQAIADQMATWRFKPFLNYKNEPVRVLTNVDLPEKVDFHFHEDMPTAPISDITIRLFRSGCYGSCPGYTVVLHGNGWVEFDGEWYTAMRGKHLYTVDPKRIAALMDFLRAKDVWSMAGDWVAQGFDAPRYGMDITIGGQTRHFADFFGDQLGMPQALNEAFDAVDDVSRTDEMIHLSAFAVEKLEAEGFDFKSQKAADLFLQSVNDDESEDAGLLRMIALGTPLTGGKPDKEEYLRPHDTVINAALRNHHSQLIALLVAKGLLTTAGHPDQAKISAAFRAAIQGGRLAAVKLIWAQAGAFPHPSLTFVDRDEDSKAVKLSPVTLLLSNPEGQDKDWEGLQIAQWLIEQGCDLRARGTDGSTLLDIAVEADDIAMARYLIANGADVSQKDKYGNSILGSVGNDEDMAMLLIENGADPWALESDPKDATDYVQGQKWSRVIRWMETHKPGSE